MTSDIVMDEKNNEHNDDLLQAPLRGILRNKSEYIIEDKFIRDRLVILCLILILIFIISPIIIVCVISL